MIHLSRYNFKGVSRLAADTGVSISAISRLIRGKTIPSSSVLARVMIALAGQLGRHLPLEEVISLTGQYPTRNICELVSCKGCLPDTAYEDDGERKMAWKKNRGGDWTGDVGEQGYEEFTPIEEIK